LLGFDGGRVGVVGLCASLAFLLGHDGGFGCGFSGDLYIWDLWGVRFVALLELS